MCGPWVLFRPLATHRMKLSWDQRALEQMQTTRENKRPESTDFGWVSWFFFFLGGEYRMIDVGDVWQIGKMDGSDVDVGLVFG